MTPYSMFVSVRGSTDTVYENFAPELIEARDEWTASAIASLRADELYATGLSEVIIRIEGSQEAGRPIAEIRRPASS
jgi:hypothetical protein